MRFDMIGKIPKLRAASKVEKLFIVEVANRFVSNHLYGAEDAVFFWEWIPDAEFPEAISVSTNYEDLDSDCGFDFVFGVSDCDEVVLFVRKNKWGEDEGQCDSPHWAKLTWPKL